MAAVCIVNLDDVRTLARKQEEQLPSLAQREWLERAIMRHVVGTRDCLKATCPSRVELSSVHVARAIAGGESIVRFLPSAKLLHDITLIVDWLAGLQDRDPKLVGKLRRVTFANALEMSQQWHRQLRKAAERRQEKGIPDDPIGAPVVLDTTLLGSGWSWHWLKSPEAREAEGEAMGHCGGSGGYETLPPWEAILSLRDSDGIPHVTLQLDEVRILQAVSKGNDKIPARYQAAVDQAAATIGTRLFVNNDPLRPVVSGWHLRERWSAHIESGVFHREDGPALKLKDGRTEWYRNGLLHREPGIAAESGGNRKWWHWALRQQREAGPAIEHPDGTQEWYRHGQRHRENGPAIEFADGSKHWFRHGKLHREDGPAIEWASGGKEWYRDGQLHREDGPAIKWPSGGNWWYRNGNMVSDHGIKP
jgi:hypothetical protein